MCHRPMIFAAQPWGFDNTARTPVQGHAQYSRHMNLDRQLPQCSRSSQYHSLEHLHGFVYIRFLGVTAKAQAHTVACLALVQPECQQYM
ncbi:hypothetical protein D3C80_1724530 [compost metagenome]